ncbi:MAG: PatB family C-S lyase [Pleurocapsa minor GSE-CHR-MK-17-07R]|jgi:cystathionine beta-lyase|nr:PatB family C-S lyase [Pleurocapsa minor GSE-CHR-MK 17-07R]
MTFLPPSPLAHREFDGVKWNFFAPDVLPLWVADTDFYSPRPVIAALHRLTEHGMFGYAMDSKDLREVIAARMRNRYGVSAATAERVLLLPNLVSGLNIAAFIAGAQGSGILLNSPIYPPFLSSVAHQGQRLVDVPLVSSVTDGVLRYEMDFDAIEAAITPDTRMWLFCNPHNPVGRSYTRAELERVAEIALRHNLLVVSDEIHSDLHFDGRTHNALASLSPEIAARTITLNAPSKAFNIPGLGLGYAVITDEALFTAFQTRAWMTGQHTSAFGMVGALSAYTECGHYLEEVMPYLQANRDVLVDYLHENMPGLPVTIPDATYLAWVDCRSLPLPEGTSPAQYFIDTGKVGFNDGAAFGEAGKGFVRINFGCSRETLMDALERMRAAVQALG